ncbi:MAG: DUF1015 domain-containing protein, partial [Chloroflexi bacterium]|nr:DUF1015 domain-containing protein [Chloroflexota bacterium]
MTVSVAPIPQPRKPVRYDPLSQSSDPVPVPERGPAWCPAERGLPHMVNVQPFRGLRYDPDVVGDWGAVLGPPYDIIDQAQTAALKESSPHQIAHIETAAGDDIAAAARILKDWRSSGAIVRDDAPSYYLHEHHFGDGQVRRAIFGAVELTPWGEGVMAHERTMPGPKATRTALRSVVGA